jgi:hypothetical protein
MDHLVPDIHSILVLVTAHDVDFTTVQDIVQEQWAVGLNRNRGILGRVRVLEKETELASMEGCWAPNPSPNRQMRSQLQWRHAVVPNRCLAKTVVILMLPPH